MDCVFYILLIYETQRYVFIERILKVTEESRVFENRALGLRGTR
jgi:hypothetical protein